MTKQQLLPDPDELAVELDQPGSKLLSRELYIDQFLRLGVESHIESPLPRLWQEDFQKRARLFDPVRDLAVGTPLPQGAALDLIGRLKWRQDHLNKYLRSLGGEPVELAFQIERQPLARLLKS